MKRVLTILLSLAAILPTRADELRIARFDAQRVFEQYQHTKDIEATLSVKRHSMGPGSDTPSTERRDKLKERFAQLTEQRKAARAGTPEQEQLDLQLQISNLELQLDELRHTVENVQRGRAQEEEVRRQRSEILREIWAAASRLGTERGYRFVVPDNLPNEGPFLSIIVPTAGDDLTEPLLTRLNEQYAASKSK